MVNLAGIERMGIEVRRRALAALLALGPALALSAGCAGGAGDEAGGRQRLIVANVHVEGYPTARGLRFFAERAAADPALRRLDLDLQLGGVLGNEKEVLEKLGFGGIHLACTSVAPLAEFSETVGVLTLPYLFRDPEQSVEVL